MRAVDEVRPDESEVQVAPDDGPLPCSLHVYRYRRAGGRIETVVGVFDAGLPEDDLIAQADEALERATFMCYAVAQADDFVEDELCFVPCGEHCEILSIHTNGWQRHYGDHRRSLIEILSDLAAAVACGRLRLLDSAEIAIEAAAGDELLHLAIDKPRALSKVRRAVDARLAAEGLDPALRRTTLLPISEAVTNMLLHGGGSGELTLRRLPDRLRAVVCDRGPGLNFLNWIEPPDVSGQASMGYGFKIITENLDVVGLHTRPAGTTLLLDRIL
jgi:anti-sigma regulatory factor (Ser/Thr protein kinase)